MPAATAGWSPGRWSSTAAPASSGGRGPSTRRTATACCRPRRSPGKLTRNAKTTLRLYDARGTLVRTVWTATGTAARRPPMGAGTGGSRTARFAAQGRYEARLTVASTLGSVVLVRPVWASAFAVTPSATTVKPGQVLRIAFAADRAAGHEARRHVQAAGQGRGLRDGHAPHRRQLPRVVQGAGRGARDRDRPDRREGHRRRRQPDVGLDPGRVVSAVSAASTASAVTAASAVDPVRPATSPYTHAA